MITIGLDFGTHQTKICIEEKVGVELSYTFMKFQDTYHRPFYTLPSVIGVGKDNLLSYGYLPHKYDGRIVRYFKQSTFRPSSTGMSQENAMYFSTWYLAYILFDLQEIYGENFTIQMGAPTDSCHVNEAKEIATRIIASSYRLVEDVFENDKKRFLSTTITELKEKTELVAYSNEVKEMCALLVFPEAYACLRPLISEGKLATGMSLMIDIGGGTTDISFFTIEKNEGKSVPQVYDFYSVNKGLNYLTCVDKYPENGTDANVKVPFNIDSECETVYINEINQICDSLRNKLLEEFNKQTEFNPSRLLNALENRPLVYCGGGSIEKKLRLSYGDFKEIKQISHETWNLKSMNDIIVSEIREDELWPILSTAYGLAISTEHDNITMKPLRDIFENIKKTEKEHSTSSYDSSHSNENDEFDYTSDFNAWK